MLKIYCEGGHVQDCMTWNGLCDLCLCGGVLAVGEWNEDLSAGISKTRESIAGGMNTKMRVVCSIKVSILSSDSPNYSHFCTLTHLCAVF